MRYQDVKIKLVEKDKVISAKDLGKLALNLALGVLGLCMTVGMLALRVVGVGLFIGVIFLSVLAYAWIFDYIVENADFLAKIRKFCKFWWVSFVLFIVEFAVLSMLRF